MVDDIKGTVERIGLKATRVRSLTGELIVFVNSDLLSTRLRNFQDRQERRIVLSIGSGDDAFRPGTFQVVWQFLPSFRGRVLGDLSRLLGPHGLQEAMNMATVRRLEQEGIGFAFPTETIHVDNLSKSTLS